MGQKSGILGKILGFEANNGCFSSHPLIFLLLLYLFLFPGLLELGSKSTSSKMEVMVKWGQAKVSNFAKYRAKC